MTTIGTAVLQIIPSLDGVSKSIDTQLGGTLRASGRTGGKQLAKGVGEGLKDLDRELEAAGKAYQKLKDRAADALGKIRTEEAALARLRDTGASDDRIIRAEERLATARRNSNRASREAADGHKALEAAQGASATTAVAAGGAFGRLSTLAAGAGTALVSAGAIAGGAALAGITALGAGVLVAGNRLYELGAQFDDLSDNLQIKTGLSGAALEELKGHVEKLGTSNVPASFGQIGDVAAEVTRNLHLTGPAFDDVTSRLANLQRMGVDVDVRSLGKAFRGFGVDAGSQAGALNSLYEASTKSGLGIDDLTGAVVKGGPALRALGLDFGASAALIANFEAAGLDGEKGMTALTKATTYFAKENVPAKQGLQDTIAEIQRLGNTPQAADLANKVFGAKGGAAFNEAIQNGTLDLKSLSDSLQTTGVDINQVSDQTADWGEKWQIFKNKVSVALEPLASHVFDAVNEQLGHMADGVIAHKDEIVGFFVDLGDIVITGAENVSHGVGGILQAFGDMIGGVGNVKGLLDDLMGDFATLRGDDAGAAAFHASAQEAYGWGESLRAAGDKLANLHLDGMRDALHRVGDAAAESSTQVGGLGNALGALPATKNIGVNVNVDPTHAQAVIDDFFRRNENRSLPVAINPNVPTTTPGRNPLDALTPGRAGGGVIPGFSNVDDRFGITPHGLIGLAGGEGIVKASATRKLGGAPFINFLNGFAEGGVVPGGVTVDSLKKFAAGIAGHGYVWGGGNGDTFATDCSGAQSTVANYITGGKGRFATATEDSALLSRGFQTGDPPAGVSAYWVGWKNGGPGGGHTAGTIVDPQGGNVNVEMGGSSGGGAFGGKAAGAAGFPNRAWIAVDASGDDPSKSNFGGAGGSAAVTGGGDLGGFAKAGSGGGSGGGGSSSSISVPSSLSGFGSSIGQQLGDLGSNLGGGKLGDLGKLGSAAGSLVDGQIASALDVFGIPTDPPWLKAISTFIGGISIGGGGGSASPLAASPDLGGFTKGGGGDPGNMHGGRAGQAPGPTYNITARDTEDAFVKAQRVEREKAAAKLSRF